MTRDEMITAFRVYGQQMGMQKMRNILDKEIDVFLNSAVIEKIRQVLGTNVNAQFADKVSIQQNSISPINYVRTLIKSKLVTKKTYNNEAFVGSYDDSDVMYIIGCDVLYHLTDKTAQVSCRFIEPTKYHNTIVDFCNAPDIKNPIFTISGNGTQTSIYANGIGENAQLSLNYIKHPVKIEAGTNCDLPDYTHDEIVQLAVQKYFISLNNTQKVN